MDKKCGDFCSICLLNDENCIEIMVMKVCNVDGVCVPDIG